jgi:hypothetical protein
MGNLLGEKTVTKNQRAKEPEEKINQRDREGNRFFREGGETR